jgi:hypothetical protein
MALARKWVDKHVPTAINMHVRTEELLEVAFPTVQVVSDSM